MKEKSVKFLRYPDGKQLLLRYLMQDLPSQLSIQKRFVEPFVRSGPAFFVFHHHQRFLADINDELIPTDLVNAKSHEVSIIPINLIDMYKGEHHVPVEINST